MRRRTCSDIEDAGEAFDCVFDSEDSLDSFLDVLRASWALAAALLLHCRENWEWWRRNGRAEGFWDWIKDSVYED